MLRMTASPRGKLRRFALQYFKHQFNEQLSKANKHIILYKH